MKYVTRDRETGNVIDFFDTKEEAEKAVEEYEAEDAKEGIYSPNFYEVTEADAADRARAIRYESGLTQAAFADRYGIPKRTIENWEGGQREAPAYVLDLLARVVSEDAKKSEV